MRNATIEDVERVQAGEYVPDVMFESLWNSKMHMKQSNFLLQERLNCGQIIMETPLGELRLVHTNNLFPIKKHAFNNTATKAKPKREHVKGKRKYEKVVYDAKRAVEVARKNGGWITLVCSGEKVKRYYATGSDWWCDENGNCAAHIWNQSCAYTHMYVPVEICPRHQATISTALSKSINQFAEDAKLGEVMRKAGWKINEGKMPCDSDELVRVMLADGSVTSQAYLASGFMWCEFPFSASIIAYRIVK